MHLARYSRSLNKMIYREDPVRGMNKMNKNMNSNSWARTLDPFVGDSGERLTGKELERLMKEVDAGSSSPEVRFVAGDDGDGSAEAVRLRQRVREREDEGGNGT